MKAIRYHAYGDSGVLKCEDVAIPEIAPDEVLVKIHSASVNPADWKFRAGWFKDFVPLPMPFIPGADFAGSVEMAGPLARRFAIGDKVFAMRDVVAGGTSAEYVAIRGDELALAPTTVPLEQAAGVPLAALTAWKALFDTARVAASQTVLIHAAAGGVGSFAVQLAKIAGARVIATASGGNVDLVKALGADQVIDYRSVDFSTVVKDVDYVLDALGGETQTKSFAVLRKGGTLATLQPPGPDPKVAEAHGVKSALVGVSPHGARLAQIAALIDAGKLRVLVDREFPLADLAAAHDYSETGRARGKIIVRVN